MSGARPLRLLLTADAVGGVWHYATDLAAALLPLGVAPTIALLGPAPSAEQRRMVPPGVTLIETGLPLDWLADGREAVLAAARALAALAAEHDLVQLNSPALGAMSYPVPVVAVAHGCLASWWEAARGGPPPAEMAWQIELARAGFGNADRVVAPTRAFAATVTRLYGLPAPPLAVHNGRRPLGSGPPPGSYRDEAFTAGRLWDQVKRTALLDAVAARLAVPFRAAGPATGPHGETVRTAHLDLLGTIGEAALADHLAARPVFVSAASFEPFGLAVLEAAQAGCPLVLADLPGFRELWDGAALFVAGDDPAAYAAAIERVVGDPGLRRTLGEAAAERARRYTPQATAAAMLCVYADLLDRRGRAAA